MKMFSQSQEFSFGNLEDYQAIPSSEIAEFFDIDNETTDIGMKFEVDNENNAFLGQAPKLEVTENQLYHPLPPILSSFRVGPPDRGSFHGDLNFEIRMNGGDTNKKKYVYSHKNNRIYVDMNVDFPINFSWNYALAPTPMYVRATPVFCDQGQREKRVQRCVQHIHQDSSQSLYQSIINHILRSTRAPGTAGVYYCGDNEKIDSWLSVIVEFASVPDVQGEGCAHAYQFVCKNSCVSGINRRTIEIMFTLEDQYAKIYGRQFIGVKVCSCPGRDMKKDEDDKKSSNIVDTCKKRPIDSKDKPAKKLKTSPPRDVAVYAELPPGFKVIGSKTMEAGLQMMMAMMEQYASLTPEDKQVEKILADNKLAIEKWKSAL